MNATSIEELRSAQNATTTVVAPEHAPVGDARMEQIRQLLLGDALQSSIDRLSALEKRQSEFEQTVLQRLDVVSQRLDALSRDVSADRRSAFDELARAMHDLGNRVRGI